MDLRISQAAGTFSLKDRFSTIESCDLANALRGLNLAILRYKIEHGKTMLTYLPARASGTAGTKITEYFASNMGPIFPVFTDEEKSLIDLHRMKAIYQSEQEPGDQFHAIDEYVASMDKAIPEGFVGTV